MKLYAIILLALVGTSVLAMGVVMAQPTLAQGKGIEVHAFNPCNCRERLYAAYGEYLEEIRSGGSGDQTVFPAECL